MRERGGVPIDNGYNHCPDDASILLSDEHKNPLNDASILWPYPFKAMAHSDTAQTVGLLNTADLPPQPSMSQDYEHTLGRWIPLHRMHEYPLSRLMQNVLNQARSSVSSGTVK